MQRRMSLGGADLSTLRSSAGRAGIRTMQSDSAWADRQLKRWMRPDAHRFIRPDWRRFVRPGFERDHPFALYERKYSADQPRVPAGNPDGGRWTDGAETAASGSNSDTLQVAGNVIYVCLAGSSSRFVVGGVKSYRVTYECMGGSSFVREGPGHYFAAIVIDPFR